MPEITKKAFERWDMSTAYKHQHKTSFDIDIAISVKYIYFCHIMYALWYLAAGYVFFWYV